MKRTYKAPDASCMVILESQPLLIAVSTGNGTPPIIVDDDEGDATEALVSPFEQGNWEW